MGSLNKVFLIGNLGRDPEIRYMPSGSCVADFSIATSESWKDKQTMEKKEKTEWHKIAVFGKLAEICGQYLKKGKQVYIEGRIQTDEWVDKGGVKRYTTKIIASQMVMLGGKGDTGGYGAAPQPQPAHSQPRQKQQRSQYQSNGAEPDFNNQQPGPGPSVTDDIPF